MSHPNNQRKKHFVDRSVQGALLRSMVGHWCIFLVVTGLLLLFIEMVASASRDVGKMLVQRHGPSVVALLVLAPIFLRDLCKLSNRFAGPMVRLRRSMRELAEGRVVAPIRFRDGDFWQDLAEDFNRVLDRVRALEDAAGDAPSPLDRGETGPAAPMGMDRGNGQCGSRR